LPLRRQNIVCILWIIGNMGSFVIHLVHFLDAFGYQQQALSIWASPFTKSFYDYLETSGALGGESLI
jgi:hypothetical protein